MMLLQHAFSRGQIFSSIRLAIVVGTLLNLINQGQAIFSEGDIDWFKLLLTYFVPFAVATYSGAKAKVTLLNSTEQ